MSVHKHWFATATFFDSLLSKSTERDICRNFCLKISWIILILDWLKRISFSFLMNGQRRGSKHSKYVSFVLAINYHLFQGILSKIAL